MEAVGCRVVAGADTRGELSAPVLAAMEDAEHNDPIPVQSAFKHIGCIKHLEHELAVLIPTGDGPSKAWKLRERLCLLDYCASNRSRELRMVLMQKIGEATEIGERVLRPLNLYRSRHGLYAGVPQLSSQRTTSACGTVGCPAR
jgi:hypothetical protein